VTWPSGIPHPGNLFSQPKSLTRGRPKQASLSPSPPFSALPSACRHSACFCSIEYHAYQFHEPTGLCVHSRPNRPHLPRIEAFEHGVLPLSQQGHAQTVGATGINASCESMPATPTTEQHLPRLYLRILSFVFSFPQPNVSLQPRCPWRRLQDVVGQFLPCHSTGCTAEYSSVHRP
jgi:hypothetical protein